MLEHTPKPAADSDLVLQAYDEYERSSHRSFATNVEDPALGRRTGRARPSGRSRRVAGPGAKQYPRLKVAVVLTNAGGLWKVTEYNLKREAC